MIVDLCRECGGKCERDQIALFLPGEVEFIAKKLDLTPQEFIDRVCNIVEFRGEEVYMIKLAGDCPFLDKENRCELEKFNCKPISGMLYPVLVGLSGDEVRIFVDYKNCPMAHRLSEDFKEKAFRIYESIRKEIPQWWLEFISRYDCCTYDDSKFEELRDKMKISPEELEECKIKEK